jgi:hypothetical protein
MSRRLTHGRLLGCLVFGLGLAFAGSPVLADHHGRTQTYEVVQGYILQPQACVAATVQPSAPPANLASSQSGGNTMTLAPQPTAPSVTLQLAPTPAPTQTLQLVPAPAPTQTLQLVPAPAPTQTLQLVPAPAPTQTLQLTPAPAPTQTLQLTPAPAPTQTLQLTVAPAPVQTLQLSAPPAQVATPVQILLPCHHKCHWFCRCK